MLQLSQRRRLDLSITVDFSRDMQAQLTIVSLFAAVLAACAGTPETANGADEASPTATERAINTVGDGAGPAATAPLEDFNLRRDKIPPLLKQIKTPYSLNTDISCEQIGAEAEALNAVRGRDWDIPPPDKDKIEDRAADGASTAFLDALASEASGLIPYRGVVRTVSGANRHRKRVLKAYERGSHRRTFLKGIGLVKGCDTPASPAPPPPTDPKVVFK